MGALTDSWIVAFVFGLLPGAVVGFGLAITAAILDDYTIFIAAVASIFVVAIVWATVGVLLPEKGAKPKKPKKRKQPKASQADS